MGKLKALGGGQGYLRAGFLGFQSSGKTYTAIKLAIGMRKFLGMKGPIAMFDTEGGSEYIAHIVKQETGVDLLGVKSQIFDDLMETAQDCLKENVSVLVVDSMTHIWRELCEAHLKKANDNLRARGRNPRFALEFQDWGPIKRKWETWTKFYINAPLHMIICGRAGFEYEHEENEQGKKELRKVGTKMKVENEFGFEPSLLVEMERIQAETDKQTKKGEQTKEFMRRAVVLKDRFDIMDGMSCINPTFEFFKPHIERLKPGVNTPIRSDASSKTELDDLGQDNHDRRKKDREILLEEIQAEMVKRWPSTSGVEKQMKVLCLEKAFGSPSWAKVEVITLEHLRNGRDMIRKMNEKCEIPEDAAVPNPHLAEIVKLSDALIAKGMDGNEVLKMVPADYQSMPVDGLLKVIGALKEKLK